MRIDFGGGAHLTYCGNIHPGETADELLANIRQYAVAIKEQLVGKGLFGLGLRLSHRACQQLLEKETLSSFQRLCEAHNFYVFTLNGFVYGPFHRRRVKEAAYWPDWTTQDRLRYTNDLARLMAQLLPPEPSLYGSISTVPGGFQQEMENRAAIEQMVRLLVLHAAELFRLEEATGRRICLALEPEPACFLETIAQTVDFFTHDLFSERAISLLQQEIGQTKAICDQFLHEHLGLCCDTCHLAIAYEEPQEALQRLRQAGVSIFKVQISSALRVCFSPGDTQISQCLAPFAEDVYLHQVGERPIGGSAIRHFLDLPLALESLAQRVDETPLEWRIHFHVPVFLASFPGSSTDLLKTTQNYTIEFLQQIAPFSLGQHFEVETYTWDVLPTQYCQSDVVTALVRELQWALAQTELL